MANFNSTADLLKGALQRAGEVTDGSSPFHALALKYMNQVYFAILSGSNEFDVDLGELWPWALSPTPKILTLTEKFTGSVSLTKGSTSGTLGATVATSLADYLFIIDSHADKYRISAHTGGTDAITLDGEFTGETNASLTYTAVKIRYDLGSDVLRLVEPFRVYQDSKLPHDGDGKVYGLDATSFRRDYPLKDIVSTVPTRFFTGYDANRNLFVEFNGYVDDTRVRVEADYIAVPTDLIDSDSDIPLIPREHRPILEYGAAYYLMADKEDGRAANMFSAVSTKMLAMREDLRKQRSNTGKDKGRLIPRLEQMRPRTINQIYR